MLILTTILRKWLLRFLSKPFEAHCQGSRAKHDENEWDVLENLIILKLHYCLHDLLFQTSSTKFGLVGPKISILDITVVFRISCSRS